MRRVLPILLLTAACGSPHPLAGLHRSGTTDAQGFGWRVNWAADRAQATRLGFAWRPSMAVVLAGAVEATEAVTGCRAWPTPRSDVALVNLALDCTVPAGELSGSNAPGPAPAAIR